MVDSVPDSYRVTAEELRMSLQKVVPFNMAALFLSAIGLMLVILGILL